MACKQCLMTQTVSLSFFRFARLRDKLWAFAMMGMARPQLARVPDIGFWKLCGSGTGEGFTPIPNTGVYAVLATWPDLDTARNRVENHALYQKYRARSEEAWTVFLHTTSARGAWSGREPFEVNAQAQPGTLAALTRASLRPRIAMRFWRRVPAISDVIGTDPNVIFKIGIGEVPLTSQITFSIWPGTDAMTRFARTSAPHATAIKAVRAENWFKEELYARFSIVGDLGTWGGHSPLRHLETAQ